MPFILFQSLPSANVSRSSLPSVDNPPVPTPGKSGGGGRKNRNKNNDADEGNDSQAVTQDAKSDEEASSAVPKTGDTKKGDESLKIRIRLNLQAKVRIDLDADIKGEVVIGLF